VRLLLAPSRASGDIDIGRPRKESARFPAHGREVSTSNCSWSGCCGGFADRDAARTLRLAPIGVAVALLALHLVGEVALLVAVVLLVWGFFAWCMAPSPQYRVVALASSTANGYVPARHGDHDHDHDGHRHDIDSYQTDRYGIRRMGDLGINRFVEKEPSS